MRSVPDSSSLCVCQVSAWPSFATVFACSRPSVLDKFPEAPPDALVVDRNIALNSRSRLSGNKRHKLVKTPVKVNFASGDTIRTVMGTWRG
jgi:hypothetical protein